MPSHRQLALIPSIFFGMLLASCAVGGDRDDASRFEDLDAETKPVDAGTTPTCDVDCGASTCGAIGQACCAGGLCEGGSECIDGDCVASPVSCEQHATCASCNADRACGWCGGSGACVIGGPTGPSEVSQCADEYRYGGCDVANECHEVMVACDEVAECCAGLDCRDGVTFARRCCAPSAASCTQSSECCGAMNCVDGSCACRTSTQRCRADADCCEGLACVDAACT